MRTFSNGDVDQDLTDVEALVDRMGLAQVVGLLSMVCDAKAEQARAEWQGEPHVSYLPTQWRWAGSALGRLALEHMAVKEL